MRGTTHDPNQRGSILVESALTILTLLLLFTAIIEAGRMAWTYNTLALVAREGTRYAIVRGSQSSTPASKDTVDTYVKDRGAALGLDRAKILGPLTIGAGQAPGTLVSVQIDYDYSMMTTLFRSASVPITAKSQTVILH